jgi:hypothetical protein
VESTFQKKFFIKKEELKLEIIEILDVQNVKRSKIKLKEKNIQMKKN